MRRTLTVLAMLLVTALPLTACWGARHERAPSGQRQSGSSGGTTVDVTIKDGKVTPNGDRVKAKVGEPVTLRIDADTAGEIHVHSTPEQEIEFDKGTSTRKLTIDKPGIVDVEDHALEQVIVQLEVS